MDDMPKVRGDILGSKIPSVLAVSGMPKRAGLEKTWFEEKAKG